MSNLDGPLYLDTSALTKLYLPEPGSEELSRLVSGRRDLQLSELAITEFVSALARRKREGGLPAPLAGTLQRKLLEHATSGYYLRVGMTVRTHRAAERILLTLDADNLRAADSLHLALALSSETRTLVTYDLRLRQAASALGLALLPG